jgi:hypothetical protein
MMIMEKTSRTLMVANLIAMCLIISIHYNTGDYTETNETLLGWNYLTQEFLVNGLARCAVPYFALMSGFFLFSQFSRHRSYKKLLKSRFHTLLLPYLLSATIIFLSLALIDLWKDNLSFLNIKTIFYGIFISPLSGQFWFLRDLCFLVAVSPLLLPKSRILQCTLGLCLFSLWALELQIAPMAGQWHIVNVETLFFFYLGGQLSSRSEILNAVVDSNVKTVAATFLLLLIILTTRIYIDPTVDLWYKEARNYTLLPLLFYKATIVFGMICLIRISAFFHENTRLVYLSGLTFFAFLFHFEPLIRLITWLTYMIVAKEFGFYLSFPAATVTVFTIAHLIARYLPRLYEILCGGRNPQKAFKRIRPRRTG